MAGFQRVASVKDFPDSIVRVFLVEGTDVAVVRHEGEYYAFSGRCPHAGYVLNYTRIRPDDLVLCSSHFAWFELKTGKVVGGPTDENLQQYRVRVEGDDVLVSTETD